MNLRWKITLTGTTIEHTVIVTTKNEVHLILQDLTITVKGTLPSQSNRRVNKFSNPFYLDDTSNVSMTLKGTNVLKSTEKNYSIMFSAALRVPYGAELTITKDSTGSLNAVTENCGAGIGGNSSISSEIPGETSGKITIEGGTVTAFSESGARASAVETVLKKAVAAGQSP